VSSSVRSSGPAPREPSPAGPVALTGRWEKRCRGAGWTGLPRSATVTTRRGKLLGCRRCTWARPARPAGYGGLIGTNRGRPIVGVRLWSDRPDQNNGPTISPMEFDAPPSDGGRSRWAHLDAAVRQAKIMPDRACAVPAARSGSGFTPLHSYPDQVPRGCAAPPSNVREPNHLAGHGPAVGQTRTRPRPTTNARVQLRPHQPREVEPGHVQMEAFSGNSDAAHATTFRRLTPAPPWRDFAPSQPPAGRNVPGEAPPMVEKTDQCCPYCVARAGDGHHPGVGKCLWAKAVAHRSWGLGSVLRLVGQARRSYPFGRGPLYGDDRALDRSAGAGSAQGARGARARDARLHRAEGDNPGRYLRPGSAGGNRSCRANRPARSCLIDEDR